MAVIDPAKLQFLAAEKRPDDWFESDIEWISNDSSLRDYATYSLLGEGIFDRILERHVGRSPENVGLDLAGGENGQALQDLFAEGILGKALLTTYRDRRSTKTERMVELDHIDGDLIRPETWQKIFDWKHTHAQDGLALIMHRPLGGLQDLKPSTYIGAANLLIDLLRQGGVLFAEVPGALYGPDMAAMCESLDERDDIAKIILGKDKLFTTAVIIKS